MKIICESNQIESKVIKMILTNHFAHTCFRIGQNYFATARAPLRFYSDATEAAPKIQEEEETLSMEEPAKPVEKQASPVEEQSTAAATAGAAAGSTVPPAKISASEQLAAQSVECDTMQEAPEPVQRMVDLEHVRSKINELDQRKLRHQEYVEMLKQLIIKPVNLVPEQKLPFKQPTSIVANLRQALRSCLNVEEVLKVTEDPQQLANELLKLSGELNTEKRKNDVVLESYMELKREMSSNNSNNN